MKKNNDIRLIQYANFKQEKVHIDSTIKGIDLFYCCECGEELVIKNGKLKIRHFSHKSKSNCGGGEGESVRHKHAKNLVVDRFIEYKEQNRRTRLKHPSLPGITYKLFEGVSFLGKEMCIKNTKFISDLVGMDSNKKQIIAIELVHTHFMEEYKKENMPINWVEINVDEIFSFRKLHSPLWSIIDQKGISL